MSQQDHPGGPPPPYDPNQQYYPPQGGWQGPYDPQAGAGYPHSPQSGYPGGGMPPGYREPAPQSIMVIGIINLVFGGLAFCCGIAGGIGMISEIEGAQVGFAYFLSMAGSGIIMVASALFIAGGIGLLMKQNWGRLASMAAGFLVILASLIEIPHAGTLGMAEVATMDEAAMFGDAGLMVITYMAVSMCACIQSLYPVIMIIMMNLKNVKEALA